jgi:hypothetical protein
MGVEQAFTNQAKQDFLRGVHQPGDIYRVALYLQETANLDKHTKAYTPAGEITGEGYMVGGMALSGFKVGLAGDEAFLDFEDPVWLGSIIADAALIYNASKENRALVTLAFPKATSVEAPWTLLLPAPGPSALLRIS